MSVARLLPLTGANDFNVGITGENTVVVFDKEYAPGAYTIASSIGDATYDIYAFNADGSSAGYTNTPSLTVTKGFNKLVILGQTASNLLSFSYKTTYTSTSTTSEVSAGPVITSANTTVMAQVNDTVTITGINFASNITASFSATGYTTTNAKNVTRTSATSVTVTRPDNLNSLYNPYTITLTNPGVTNPTGSNANRLTGIVAGTNPVWVTGSVLTYTGGSAYDGSNLSATDADGHTITYSVVSGTLPSGLSLASNGTISGTANARATVTFRALASDGGYTDKAITFNLRPVWSTTSPLPSIQGTTPYSQQLTANDDVAGVTYSLLSGSLPSGITLSSAGLISGTAASTGTSSFSVRATDSDGGVADRAFSLTVSPGIVATGGTTFTSNGYKYHRFTGSDTFSVVSGVTANAFEALIVAGGGAGGTDVGGGGGAGGVIFRGPYTISPGSYSVVVGAGGAGQTGSNIGTGNNSTFNGMTAFGGGAGPNWGAQQGMAGGQGNGGCGAGGAARNDNSWSVAGSATQTSNGGGTGYGNRGGFGSNHPSAQNLTGSQGLYGAGGGGAGAVGQNGTWTGSTGSSFHGAGGNGLNTWSAWASATSTGDQGYFAGGGGAGSDASGIAVSETQPGGLGGGGSGNSASGGVGTSGAANTGGGAGGSNGYPANSSQSAGGSGIVIVRYPE